MNEKILLVSDLDTSDESILFKQVFEKLLKNTKPEIRLELESYINENINEGFFDKLKERFPKAMEVSHKLSDKAESVLNSIIQKSKDAVSFVGKVKEGIKKLFIDTITSSKEHFMEQLKVGKLKEKLAEVENTKKESLTQELKLLKDVVTFYRKHFMGKVLTSTDTNLTQFFTNEQEPVVESVLNESGNVISTLVHKIESIPPFSWLHNVASASEKGINVLVKAISDLTKAVGGPEFQIPVISLLLALGVEYMVKSTTGSWLLELVGPTPLGVAIKGIKIVASCIALIVALDAVIGGKILGSEENHH